LSAWLVSFCSNGHFTGEKPKKIVIQFDWKFKFEFVIFSSMVIRDLTLRSAASFGSFHLIRLLYDEYIFYLVEHRVAMVTGETPIAVMSEFANMTLRPKDEDDAGSGTTTTTSVPPSPSGSSASLHVGISTPLSSSHKSSAGNNNSQQHLQHSMADGSSNNVKRPKLS
jgi:regulatory factor X 1/2/3